MTLLVHCLQQYPTDQSFVAAAAALVIVWYTIIASALALQTACIILQLDDLDANQSKG